jgi:CHAT domain-containing protein/Tfp pilus assembly protein PilF
MTEDTVTPLIHKNQALPPEASRSQAVDTSFDDRLDAADLARREHRHLEATAILRSVRLEARAASRLDVVGRALLVLAYVHLERGHPDAAQRAVRGATALLDGHDADALVTHATLLWRTDRLQEADTAFERASHHLDGTSALIEFKCYNNWFGVLCELGRLDEARRCLDRATVVAQALAPTEQLIAAHNRGNLAAANGELTAALGYWTQAEQMVRRHQPSVLLETYVERLAALLDLGLYEEALALAEQTRLAARGHPDRLLAGDATLRCAEAALASGAFTLARSHALDAEQLFIKVGQPGRRLWARALAARALAGTGTSNDDALDELNKVVQAMLRLGHHRPLQEMHLAVARLAWQVNRRRLALHHFRRASVLGERSNPLEKIRGTVADVYIALDDDDIVALRAAVDRSLIALDHFRRGFDGLELRSRAGALTYEIIDLAMIRELRDGELWRCWRYAEHARARSLTSTPTRDHAPVLSIAKLQRGLDPWQTVLSLLDIGGTLQVAVIRHDAIDWHLGPPTDVLARAFKDILRSLRRAELEPDRAANSLVQQQEVLSELLAPILEQVQPNDDLIIIPPASLLSMPWMAVPSFLHRAVVVAPSASLWVSLAPTKRPTRVRCIGGPDLPNVQRELDAVARYWRLGDVSVITDATIAESLSALAEGDLVHFAGHGEFRHDNPMFSGLVLADGSLTARDVDRQGHAAATVVLSACSVGQSSARPGDETLGLMTTLLANGTSMAIVSLVPIPDDGAALAMDRLHARLAGGQHPSLAIMTLRTMEDLPLSVRYGLTCFGRE